MPINQGTHSTDIRVYYEDTDSGGIVYYANYLKFAERGRTEYLRETGFDHRVLLSRFGLGFVVRRCVVDYRKPAVLDDVLVVETELRDVAGARFEMAQRVLRNDMIMCELAITLGCVNQAGRPSRLPEPVREALKRTVKGP